MMVLANLNPLTENLCIWTPDNSCPNILNVYSLTVLLH